MGGPKKLAVHEFDSETEHVAGPSNRHYKAVLNHWPSPCFFSTCPTQRRPSFASVMHVHLQGKSQVYCVVRSGFPTPVRVGGGACRVRQGRVQDGRRLVSQRGRRIRDNLFPTHCPTCCEGPLAVSFNDFVSGPEQRWPAVQAPKVNDHDLNQGRPVC